mmetsp:Transcript_14065/g.16593  ORF Transcript_14065/g.16593 Transcript_14065/m.16593 type:complete len:277 (+) Transcript_14065:59-889(+)|eukprot:CAMPEP_0198248348 /NCGR_PEP_ID=MMETSP1447-20131203/103_1 /TAXON_ID=420782 /ORGANISM="Chaetoceros dichaeta, Strain CCMP1751" /LENGTH=276 /DNA_ID=CAMNT_0043932697 /DNA_START=22 /DNA_END=852 /DNA_ORIENTATION=+
MSHLHTALVLLLAVTSLVGSNAALPFTRSGLPAPVYKPNHAEEFIKNFQEQRLAPRGGSVSSTIRDSSAFISPALVKAIGTTTITYMIADFFSNFLQHPTQKMDYGVFNKFIGREVDQKWWGTRTEHIVGVAGCLAITDHASQAIFKNILSKPLCFANSPASFVAHTFFFIFTGVVAYVGVDAALNPNHAEGTRMSTFKEETYNTYVGTNTAWFEPYVPGVVGKIAGAAAAGSWLGSSLLPATLAYATVKGVGWNDWGNSGLTDHEVKLNTKCTFD